VARYSFLTTWLLGAPIEPVWDAIFGAERWPEWWRGVTRVEEVEPGGADGVGKVFDIAWRSFLPYELKFAITVTRVEHPQVMEGAAVGDLTGHGRWRLFPGPDATAVTDEWNVETTKRWMNLVAPVARPIFRWNHDWVMRSGGNGLAGLLDAPLLARS
jgi:Polyketide cyclase / dehydrase and lipid transport